MCYTLRYKEVREQSEKIAETTTPAVTRETPVTEAAKEIPAAAGARAYVRFRAAILRTWSSRKQRHVETA